MHEAPKRIPSITTESEKSDSANEAVLRVTNTTLAVGITSEEEEEKIHGKTAERTDKHFTTFRCRK